MAEIEGKRLICDVCGAEVFLKYVGDGEADGGFSRWRKYEERPKGWHSINIATHAWANVCPSCVERIGDAVQATVAEIREEASHDA